MPRVTDAHRETRRRQILDASIECFAREGFHRTSMAQIIAEAGVSAGTIYLYFTGKRKCRAIAEVRHAQSALAFMALYRDLPSSLSLGRAILHWLGPSFSHKEAE